MPHKFYHGKTGRVFNVTKRAVGAIVNKKIGYVFHDMIVVYTLLYQFSIQFFVGCVVSCVY